MGGKEEKNHGSEILIKLPSLLNGYEYAIAIQVKDYEGAIGQAVIEQINKADKYWNSENIKLIEKWIIVTNSSREENIKLTENNSGVKIIFASDLEILLSRIAKKMIDMN